VSTNAIPRCERVVDFLDHWCAIQPDVVLDEFDGLERTYRQVKRDVDACAASLLGLGIGPGDRVAMLTDPRPEFLTVFLALSRVGASWVGLSPRYTRGELEHVVGDSRPAMLVATTSCEARDLSDDVQALAHDTDSIRHVVSVGDVQPRAIPFERLLAEPGPDAAARLEVIAGGVDPERIALIVYTSGTTGEPKGAMISHRALAIGCWLQGTRMDRDRPRTLANLPVNHIGGVMDLVSVPLAMGGTIHFMDRFSPERTLSLLQSRRITVWGQIPTMFQLVAAVPGFDEADLSSLQSIWWGGAPMS
jgi:acyl-CoA synthetase (AMP-forming)/AMP-acid ligase II